MSTQPKGATGASAPYGGARSSSTEPSGRKNLGLPFDISSPNP